MSLRRVVGWSGELLVTLGVLLLLFAADAGVAPEAVVAAHDRLSRR